MSRKEIKLKPLISIIVPVYQVEPYLEKCLLSIISQTYSNLEIILIDDGSKDRCPVICDEFAQKDNRFKVLHISNAGIANARNLGVENSTGSYISFVDSDDFISNDYIEYLYQLLIEYNAEISACSFQYINESGTRLIPSKATEDVLEFSKEEALEHLLFNQKFHNSSWGKLYKKELFQEITFPKGHLYEDLAVTYKVVAAANHIVYGDSEKYFYLQRAHSILNSTFSRQHMDSVYFSQEIVTYMEHYFPVLIIPAKYRLFAAAFEVILKTKKTQTDLNDCVATAWEIIKKNRVTFITYKFSALDYRCLALASLFGLTFTRKLWALWLLLKSR